MKVEYKYLEYCSPRENLVTIPLDLQDGSAPPTFKGKALGTRLTCIDFDGFIALFQVQLSFSISTLNEKQFKECGKGLMCGDAMVD